MRTLIIGVLGGLLVGTPPALACGHRRVCHAPVKVVEKVIVAVPVAVPVVVAPVPVPLAASYNAPPPSYNVIVVPQTVTVVPATVTIQPAQAIIGPPALIGPAPVAPAQPAAPSPLQPSPYQPAPAAPQQPPPNAGQSPEHLQVVSGALQKNCIACHAAGVADAKGMSFVLVDKDNRVPPFSITEKRQILKRINSDDAKTVMPPASHGGKMDEKTRAAFSEWLGVK